MTDEQEKQKAREYVEEKIANGFTKYELYGLYLLHISLAKREPIDLEQFLALIDGLVGPENKSEDG